MRKYLIIVSEEKGYAERLCRSLEQRNALPLTPVPFESAAEIPAFCNTYPVAVVAADESIMEEGLLSGLSGRPVCLSLSGERSKAAGETVLFRYSGLDEIIHRILDILGDDVSSGNGKNCRHSVRLVTVYSPALPSVKTAFAITLAAMEKRIRKTLYLNLEEFGGMATLLGGSGEKTLSDAMYYLKQDALDSTKLTAMICTARSIDYIPPMLFADDVRETTGEDWVKLVSRIAEISGYEEIIVDLPESLYVGQDLIDVCDELYIPVGGDGISGARLKDLERYMERPEHRHMQEKARYISLTGIPLPPVGNTSDYPEELMYGKFGEALIKEVNAGKEEKTGD